MTPHADPWYTSATFLGIAGVAAAVIFGVVGIWAAFRAANPRQELAYQVQAMVPLLAQEARSARDLVEIRVDGRVLAHPRVIELRLVNRGRRDIPTSAFDQNRPLRLDLAAPIVKILKNRTSPDEFRPPRINVDDTAIVLGPDLLKKGQAVTLSLLVDGKEPRVTVPEPPFIDIRVRSQDAGERISLPVAYSWAVGGLGAVGAAVPLVALIPGVKSPTSVVLLSIGAVVLLSAAMAAVSAVARLSRL